MSRCRRDNHLAVNHRPGRSNDQPAIRRTRECGESMLDLACAAYINRVNSTPSEGPVAPIAATWLIPLGLAGSRSTAARVTLGTISFRSSSHFELRPYSKGVKPVMWLPGRAGCYKATPDRIDNDCDTMNPSRAACSNADRLGLPAAKMTLGPRRGQFRSIRAKKPGIAVSRTNIDLEVLGLQSSRAGPTPGEMPQVGRAMLGSSPTTLQQHPNTSRPSGLLCARSERPPRCRATQHTEKFPPFHVHPPRAQEHVCPLWVISEQNALGLGCPLYPGAFNRSVQHQSQSIGRGFEAQGLSRALIEPQRN